METEIENYRKLKEEKRRNELLSKEFESLGWDRKKEYLKFECNNTCQKCGNNEWMGEKIPLEIDHVDGNNVNNEKNNLIVLCPNCHGLTNNWRGRNKTNKRFRIDDETLLSVLLKNEWNFRQSLIDIGLTAKGGNYKRCHKIKREYENFGFITPNKILIDIDKESFLNVFHQCSNYDEIGKILGISSKRARNYSVKFECNFPKKELPSLEELFLKYKEFGNMCKLALYYGMSDNGVRKWFKKYGIDPKTLKSV
jgi:hypothetical protein